MMPTSPPTNRCRSGVPGPGMPRPKEAEPRQRCPTGGLLNRAVGPGLLRSRCKPAWVSRVDTGRLGPAQSAQKTPTNRGRCDKLYLQDPSVPRSESPHSASEAVLAIGSAPEREAPELARILVSERLVACVNLLEGARSIYRWQGELGDEAETVLVMTTTRAQLDSLARRYLELHSYNVPGILVLSPAAGRAAHLDWMIRATTVTA